MKTHLRHFSRRLHPSLDPMPKSLGRPGALPKDLHLSPALDSVLFSLPVHFCPLEGTALDSQPTLACPQSTAQLGGFMNTMECKLNHCQIRASGPSGTGLHISFSPLLKMKFGLPDKSHSLPHKSTLFTRLTDQAFPLTPSHDVTFLTTRSKHH